MYFFILFFLPFAGIIIMFADVIVMWFSHMTKCGLLKVHCKTTSQATLEPKYIPSLILEVLAIVILKQQVVPIETVLVELHAVQSAPIGVFSDGAKASLPSCWGSNFPISSFISVSP